MSAAPSASAPAERRLRTRSRTTRESTTRLVSSWGPFEKNRRDGVAGHALDDVRVENLARLLPELHPYVVAPAQGRRRPQGRVRDPPVCHLRDLFVRDVRFGFAQIGAQLPFVLIVPVVVRDLPPQVFGVRPEVDRFELRERFPVDDRGTVAI